ncbi:MAG: HldE protein [Chlamydiae bacterium CG10_big_fil_rev_8_21_14_0_10_42_34]|nr:MAG: HldE protein [Chlamydiae bacterium CG10_big_fil_rev_8_21_14_0_10_42_34]
MVKLAKTFRNFQPFKALVLGDFMLDTYTTGKVKRISPEAPVPVIEVTKKESRPGGAGNVALNLKALGATVFSMGRIGNDLEGRELQKLLQETDTTHLITEPNYITPVKNRLIADSQQLIRIDFETITALPQNLEDEIIENLKTLIPKVQVVAISDYGKGFLTDRIISTAIELATSQNIPTVVDPKGSDFTKYRGATVLKPNLSESYTAAKCPPNAPLEQVAKILTPLAKQLLITRSEAGISIFDSNATRFDLPVHSKQVKDVTGAGDTVLAMICLGLANGLNIHQAAQLGNIAAGISIERLGCAQITLSEIAARLLEVDSDTKVFDENHTYALHQVLQGKNYSLLVLDKGQGMSTALFRTIRKLSDPKNEELIIYVADSDPDDEFINLLSSLHEIDHIILQTESLKNLCDAISPHKIFHLKEERLIELNQAKVLLDSILNKSSHFC